MNIFYLMEGVKGEKLPLSPKKTEVMTHESLSLCKGNGTCPAALKLVHLFMAQDLLRAYPVEDTCN